MSIGDLSEAVIYTETAFGVKPVSPTFKRIGFLDDSLKVDKKYTDPNEIKGNRIKSANIATQESVGGSISVICGPENGFGNLLHYTCGQVQNLAGYFRRERITGLVGTIAALGATDAFTTGASEGTTDNLEAIGSTLIEVTGHALVVGETIKFSNDTNRYVVIAPVVAGVSFTLNRPLVVATVAATTTVHPLTHVGITAATVVVYKKVLGGQWVLLTNPADYTVNLTTGVITFAVALVATDQVMVTYTEVVAGVFTHIITSADQPSFGYWNNKGDIDLFEYFGSKVDGAKLEINSSDFIKLGVDLKAQKEYIGSETGDTFPVAAQSALDPFIFAQAEIFIDWVFDPLLEKLGIDIKNNLDERYSIRCDPTVRALTPGKQEIALSTELEFVDMDKYNRFRLATRGVLEFKIGECQGVEIGATGRNYGFQGFIPSFRFETADVPTKTGTIMVTAGGFADYDYGLGIGYQFVVINTEATL